MSFNILVVDDSETVRAVIAKTLELSGVDLGALHQAGNGLEALEVLKREWVDLVFCDINMPIMNGVEMIDCIRKDAAMSNLPIVVISTEGSKTRMEDLKEKGVRAYIRKPFTPELLRSVVESLLGERNGK